MSIEWVKYTTYASIVAQLVTGVIGAKGLVYTLPQPHKILVDALRIEMVVQGIELLFYIFLVANLNIFTMAAVRYYDWFITTPLMLFSTCVIYNYLGFIQGSSEIKETSLTIHTFIQTHQKSLIAIFFANMFMLIFGYLGETGKMSLFYATFYGFISLAVSMYIVYIEFGHYVKENKYLFYLFVAIWTLYGVVYLLPPIHKNITYNFLDIVAKNFFGIFLYYKIKDVHSKLPKTV